MKHRYVFQMNRNVKLLYIKRHIYILKKCNQFKLPGGSQGNFLWYASQRKPPRHR